MPGAVDLDENTINPVSDIAYKDDAGNWRAGPDAKKGYQQGQFIDSDYAERATSIRRTTNLIKSIQRARDVSESEARDLKDDMVSELEDAETKEERRDIWQKYGSP